jgi:hypothetical protein
MLRVAYLATRSSMPTRSTVPVSARRRWKEVGLFEVGWMTEGRKPVSYGKIPIVV